MKKYIVPTLISLALTLPVFAEDSANTAATPENAPATAVKSPEAPPASGMDRMQQEQESMRQEHMKRMEEERQNFLQSRLIELQQQVQDIQAAIKSPPPDMGGQNGNPNMNNMPNNTDMSAPPPWAGRRMMGGGGCPGMNPNGMGMMQQHQQRMEDSLNRIEKMLEKIAEQQAK